MCSPYLVIKNWYWESRANYFFSAKRINQNWLSDIELQWVVKWLRYHLIYGKDIVIVTDNRFAKYTTSDPVHEYQKSVNEIALHLNTTLSWVCRHRTCLGNRVADVLTRIGANLWAEQTVQFCSKRLQVERMKNFCQHTRFLWPEINLKQSSSYKRKGQNWGG